MGPDLVLGHAHQACCDGHLLLRISRKVLCSGNGLLDRGWLMAHPWWTRELGRLGLGAHTRGHDRTIPPGFSAGSASSILREPGSKPAVALGQVGPTRSGLCSGLSAKPECLRLTPGSL